MKGIILAGGTGTRLRALTKVTNKHLLPVYDKPMIYFPINTLKSSGIDSILIVTDKRRTSDFLLLLGSGDDFGVRFTYALQESAKGIGDALSKANDFVNTDDITVILGDNIIFGEVRELKEPMNKSCRIFLKEVKDPERFGIAYVKNGKIQKIVEKPKEPKSNLAIIGLYQYKSNVFDVISKIRPSKRNEMEITDVNKYFLENDDIEYQIIDNEWIDAGTIESLFEANKMERHFLNIK
jgi:glucose-1-phosphate thymidylyltransferase